MSILPEEHTNNKAEVRQTDSATGGKLMGAVAVLREKSVLHTCLEHAPCLYLSFMIPLGFLFGK